MCQNHDMRTLIYARVSLDAGGQGRSVAEQEAECRAWADREGWTVTHVIEETGSASRYARSTGARTKWVELTTAVATRDYDILLTWEASRATRQLAEYAELADLCALNGVQWGYSGTVHDLTTRDARFRTGLDALLAQDESGRISERIQRSVNARAAQGRPHGKIPYGYRREYDPTTGALLRQVPNEETAPVVVEIYERVAAGDSLYGIARDLTNRGIPMPRPARTRHNDAAWIPQTLKTLVQSPTYIGKRTHKGSTVDATWAALVTVELQAKAQANLRARTSHNTRGDSQARWLLSGIARCGIPGCGGPMRHITNRGSDSYMCGWCFKVCRKIANVDPLVTERLLLVLGNAPQPNDENIGDDLRDALDQVDALERRLESFTEQGADGSLSPATLSKIETRLTPLIVAAKTKARRLAAPAQLSRWDLSDPESLWGSLNMADRRALLKDAVTVTIHPAGMGRRIFNPELIEVTPTWANPASGPTDDDATD